MEPAAAAPALVHLLDAILPVAVVHLAFLGVGEDLVSCSRAGGEGRSAQEGQGSSGGSSGGLTMTDFRELVCRPFLLLFSALNLVRVHLQRKLTVGALDRGLIGPAMDVQNVIIIAPAQGANQGGHGESGLMGAVVTTPTRVHWPIGAPHSRRSTCNESQSEGRKQNAHGHDGLDDLTRTLLKG